MTASDALDNPSYFDVGAAASADQAGRPTPEPPPPPAAPAAPAPPTKPLLPLLKRRQRGAMTTVAGPRAVSQGAATTRRLGFRWLLRSMSGSSTSLQQIALGQPRPGDVAPPSPTSDALAGVDGPLASPGPVVSPGRLRDHPGTAPRAAPGYYNVEPRRRHSVGAVMHSARPRTAASHGPSSTAPPSTGSAAASSLADDIVMVWSGGGGTSAASLWITYLQSCFVEICRKRGRPSFRTSDVSVDELAGEGAVAERWRTRLELAKLVVLVVCPVMLARLSSSLAALAGPMARLDSDRALIMLLGVHEYELQPEHRAVLGGDCRRMAVRDQDASFVGEFLAVAMDILVRAWRARAAKERRTADGGALFSLAPKKVKQGMNKVLALLVSPLQPADHVSVAVHKGAPSEAVALPSRSRNPYTLQFSIPEEMLDVSAMVSVTVSVNGQPLGTRQLKCESRLRELDRILRARDNPLQYLCQTLGFGPSDRDALDNSLLCSYLRNVPPHFNLLQDPGPASRAAPSYSCEQYPTLLHFAAHFGLERLAMALLEGPGGEQACYIRNCNDLTPAELGERAGYSRLACALQGYMQMSELSNVYTILQNMTDADGGGTAFASDESGCYLSPRPASETYSVPPPPLPAPQGIAPPPFPAPTASHAGTPPPEPYVDMKELTSLYQNMPRRSQSSSPTAEAADDASLCPDAVYQDIDEHEPDDCCSLGADTPDGVLRPRPGWTREGSAPVDDRRAQRRPRRGSDPLAGREDAVDDDLMDVIRDLKSSSFSLGEVEHLVHSWRGRNATHQSFRDKQEQLARMREELQQVERRLGGRGQDQAQGTAAAARPSPLERIKRVFTKARHGRHAAAKDKGSRPAHRGDSAPPGTASTAAAAPPRSPSSLSRRSSSSSTWSGRSSDAAEHPVEVDEVSWRHPVSPASVDSHYVHYVSPMGIRPVVAAAAAAVTPVCSGGSRGAVDRVERADRLDLADDGFPLDPSGFSSYVNVHLPSWPPPVPAKAGLKDLPEDAV